jgi:hypothetical protein
MSAKYETEDEILELVESFENGTIPRSEWNHAGHLTVALYYCAHHDFATATGKMRRNLLHHLKNIGVDFTKEMPYHETLTAFWMRTIDDFRKTALRFWRRQTSWSPLSTKIIRSDFTAASFYSATRLARGLSKRICPETTSRLKAEF